MDERRVWRVLLRKLPLTVERCDVVDFFEEIKLETITFISRENMFFSGMCHVQLSSEEDYHKALANNGKQIKFFTVKVDPFPENLPVYPVLKDSELQSIMTLVDFRNGIKVQNIDITCNPCKVYDILALTYMECGEISAIDVFCGLDVNGNNGYACIYFSDRKLVSNAMKMREPTIGGQVTVVTCLGEGESETSSDSEEIETFGDFQLTESFVDLDQWANGLEQGPKD